MSLLTALEDQKRLRGFSVQDEVARARIDDDTEIVLGVDHFSMAFKEGFPGGAMLQSLLDSVMETVKPRISYLTVRYQHLCDLSHAQDYEKARAAAALSLLGSIATEISAVDSAILIDGTAGGGNTRYKVEFGVVNQHEAALRLTEEIGRISSGTESRLSSLGTAVKDLPEIALYVDSYWNQGIGSQATGSDDVYSRVKDCREYSNKLVGVLLARVDNTLKGDG